MAVKIYCASKTKHAQMWKDFRSLGSNIISTWIDEAGKGETKDMADLCNRCINECKECDALIVYAEPGDYLKGAFIEMGVVIGNLLQQIYLVGEVLPKGSTFTHASNVHIATDIYAALRMIDKL